MLFMNELNTNQIEVLLASILGDGEITKAYKNSRRINLNYREHSGTQQINYRKWKQQFFPDLMNFSYKTNTLFTKSSPMFTELFPHFYDKEGNKHIPFNIISNYITPLFLSVLYMDDGSLILSKRINHNLKKIYLTPSIVLYLQCFPQNELERLSKILLTRFAILFSLQKRNDGFGNILKITTVDHTLKFLKLISDPSETCSSMYYKTNWKYRLKIEKDKLNDQLPDYEVIVSSSERYRTYTATEEELIIKMKNSGSTDKEISDKTGRSYWSIVYKLRELRKKGYL